MIVLTPIDFAHGQARPSTLPSLDEPHGKSVEGSFSIQRPLFGQLARSMFAPIRTALLPPQSIPETPAIPTREDLARMLADGGYSPAEITAVKIKIDESQAKAREAAVRYLATVDCHYHPDAEAGLIAALRADRVESVRYEAAVALGSCKGATRKIIDALTVTALGHETDGKPSETSERVRAAARQSLQRALTVSVALYPNEFRHLTLSAPVVTPTGWIYTSSLQPTSNHSPTFPIAGSLIFSPMEREAAQKVNTHSASAPASSSSRSVVDWIQSHLWPRNSSDGNSVDPRLRGLTPLGSTQLAIPASTPRYNRN